MSSQDTLTILACQIAIPETISVSARDAHLAETALKVRLQLDAAPADLVVLPELSSMTYSRAAFDQLDALSEPLDGVSFQTWQQVAIAHDVHIAYSFARHDQSGTYISVAVVTPEGRLAGYYDKLHMCQYGASMEKEYFDRGRHIFTFDVRGFTCAPIICYDIRIPELSRVLTLRHDVDVILHCGAYFRDASFATWHAFTTARAMENQIFLLSLNRAGEDWGNSVFCPPWMDENTQPTVFSERHEEFRHLTLPRQSLYEARETYTFLKDRLPDYDVL